MKYNSSEVKAPASAHYSRGKKEIHFMGSGYFPTLVHELTHHFSPDFWHGKDFCETEDFLFSVCYTEITGKQPQLEIKRE